jgi:hypothetical protein
MTPCARCVTPAKCGIYGCCPGTWPAETTAAKTTAERVQAMRAARDALGLKRLELYAHPDDWDKIKALAFTLNMKRQKPAKKRAG